jgi:adhesin/invasin
MLRRVAKLLLTLTAAALLAQPLAAQQSQQSAAPLRGDVDGDGKVTVADARAVISFVVGRPLPANVVAFPNGDADGDGRVTTTDAAIIMAYAQGRDVARYPVGAAVAQDPQRLGILTCNGDIRQRRVTCGTQTPQSPEGRMGNLIVGGQGTYVTLTSSNIAVAADTFAFDVTVTNLLPQALGTTDGSLHANGVRVFFHDGPTATAGAGTMSVGNAHGTAMFTGSNQRYFQYDEVLDPQETSGSHRWKLAFDPGVTNFQFKVYVSAEVQFPNGWVDIYPPAHAPSPTAVYGDTLRATQTLQLEDTVRTPVGNPVPGQSATWSSSNTGVATVDANTGLVTAVADGTTTITASAAGGTRTGTYTIVVSTPSPAQTHVVASPTTLTVGDTSTITVQVKNAAGGNITEGGDDVQLTSDGGTLSAVTDHGDGSYTASLTTTLAGIIKVTGTLNGAQLDTASVTFTSDTAASMTKTAGDGQTATAGSAVGVAPQVRLLDGLGNPVSGVSVTFAPVGSTNGSVTGGTTTTDASGYAAVGSWTLDNTAKVDSLTATAGSFTVTFTATGVAGAPANMVKSAGDGQSATAGSDVATAPAVTITDANGNPVAGVSVTFSVASGGGSVTGGSATTDAAGVATVGSWTLGTTAGANTLDAASAGLTTVTFTATGTAGAPANMVKSAGDAQTATVNTAVATAPAVTITDSNGNPVSGVSVTFSVASGGGSVTGGSATTDASGVATVGSWTLGTTAGANTLDAASAGLTTVTFTATGTPDAPANIAKTAGDGQSATVNTAVAVAPQVQITDQYGNPVPGVSVTFAVGSGGGSVTGGGQTTNATGHATVGSWTMGTVAGANTLDATAGALSTTFSATGTPDVPATITKTSTDPQNGTAGNAVSSAPAVNVKDQYGNNVPGVTITYAVTGGGGSVTGGTPTTDASGNAAVGSWTLGAGPTTNTLQASATPAGTSSPVTFTAYIPPVAGADSSQAMGNTTLGSSVAPNVLSNDVTINGGAISITTTGALSTVRGGTVTLAADGSFTYLPPAGNVLRDSVQYTINDTHLSADGWIKLRFVGRVWYVDNTNAGAADGRDVSPYTTVGAAATAAAVNDTILVRTGSGTTGGGTLKNGQLLRGQGHSAAFTTTLNGSTVTLLATGTRPNVGGLTLGNGNTLRGMRIVNGAGAGLTGASVGTLSVTEASVHATGGAALDLTSGTATITVDSLRSTNSAAAGVALSNVAGTVTVNGGTASAIVNPTGTAVSINGSNPTFTFPGTISKTNGAGTGVSLTSLTGGTVSFTGPSVVLSTGTGTGINMTSSAATVSFVDSVKVNTTSGTGLNATGGGTLTIEGTRNSIVSTAGRALNVSGTTIGAAGLTFRNISSTSGANGILLANTGAGALTVTGEGASDGTNTTRGRTTARSGGGTVTLGSGGTISGATGDGVSLSNTGAVTLRNMVIQNGAGDGIDASSVSALTIDNARITGHTNNSGVFLTSVGSPTIQHSEIENNAFGAGAPGADIHNVRLISNTGTGSVTNSVIANTSAGAERQLQIFSTTGTLNISVNNNRIAGSTVGDGVGVYAFGSSNITASFQNDSIHDNSAFGIDSGTETTQSATLSITVNNSKFRNNFVGVTVAHGSSGTNTFNITNNNFQNHGSVSVNINRLGAVSFTGFGLFSGTVSGNTIGTAGVANSGSPLGSNVIDVKTNGNGGTTRVAILNNVIREVGNDGIRVIGRDANVGHTLHARIENNNIANFHASALTGIRGELGAASGDKITMCLDIENNTVTSAPQNGIRVRSVTGGSPPPQVTLTMPSFTSPGDAYLAGRNPAATGLTANASFANGNAGSTSTAGNCTTP